ncbi:hypothetical protein CLAFUW4_00919 [Fulvia fulva]|uniref:Uncharacterized protein n=1 Tax=Passalora fulva TaxID=5499 RepID=A0A9Q8L8B8_PASFU|nr:uncharacterized protein CLAFUR5_00924 [Fulvia fulva]KAK4634807.1 hypothetical protein CLAFUR4_00920 [Fulvia fulva]KAK4638574.1 hypothetical protein CLAFUR0_00920 [Fulvia fulva]UJO12755.1 hypothetical protein CLAFUR5_00924 [Fulvia fulva]WPV08626.1 hypothetical protein CLAFUW4_00919 [Fulvia fulva]WPV24282.1 hypothetical protein CLAFUW7_00897 [Fulvia fulva]
MGRPKKRSRTEGPSTTASSTNGMHADASTEDQHTGLQSFDTATHYGSFESAWTPGGSLQPWLQSADDWNNDFAGNMGVPALTPDSSTHSPSLAMPPELGSQHSTGFGYGQMFGHHDTSTSMLVDPTLARNPVTISSTSNSGMPQYNMQSCACLSTMYLTLTSRQSMDTSFTFPFSLHPLREAMQAAATVLSCEECPMRCISAIQNTQLLGTLLMSIAERFSKLLDHISSESVRATLAGETKKFRLADLNTSISHLHAGGLGCQAAFSVNLSPEEWRSMCKKVVRAEVHGPSDVNDCCPYLLGLATQLEERQNRWHAGPPPEDFPHNMQARPVGQSVITPKEDRLCLKMVHYSQKLAEGLDFS